MKQTLLLPLVLLFALATAQAQQQVVIYYNQKWEVTKKENAAYTRLATVPDSIIQKGHLYNMQFDKAVADYYSTGRILARGSYSKGQKQGDWLFYYPNGQLQCQARYENGKPSGLWKYWRENGEREQEILFEEERVKCQSYWSESGVQEVTNGTGNFVALLPVDNNSRLRLQGTFLNGAQHGKWLYTLLADGQAAKPVMEQVYKEGILEKGQTARIGRQMIDLIIKDSFGLLTNFPYLNVVELWAYDTNVFKPDYPVLAYMLKFDVREIQEAQQQEKSYQVVFPTASGTDTLIISKERVNDSVPVFPGGERAMLAFLAKNMRYPATAQRAGVEGFVVVSFTVMQDGQVGDIKVIKSLGHGLDKETVGVVKLMPAWKPAVLDGKPAATVLTLPVRFTNMNSGYLLSVPPL